VTTADITPRPSDPQAATLKPNAIGFLDSLVIGLASTAPAYSLAAVIGSLVVVVGIQAPGALLASFVPMFLIAGAFFYMNRADRDAGTTFSWVTRTLGPWVGWIGGWAVCMTGILVIGSLADVGARYTYLVVGWDSAAGSKAAVMALAIAYIVVLTWVCILGTELSARLQNVISAVASTQTTIIPASRTALSMARSGAFPSLLARIHSRFRTPHVATATVAFLAIAWYLPANVISENFLFDSLSALALMIAFYYTLSGVACIVYYRRELTKSIWNFVIIGVGPAIGALLLGYLFVEATRSLADTGESYSGQEILGLAPPLVIGYGFLLLGVILMVVWRVSGGGERYFHRHAFETVDPAVASGAAQVADDPTA